MSVFSERLKKARLNAGYKQDELAKKVGSYQTKYQNWEAGHHEPDIDVINKLAEALGVSTDWLLGHTKEVKPYPSEYDKEIFLLREEAKKYGPDSIKRLRKMLPLIFEKTKGKPK